MWNPSKRSPVPPRSTIVTGVSLPSAGPTKSAGPGPTYTTFVPSAVNCWVLTAPIAVGTIVPFNFTD
jgi:hypothetical protein